MKIVQIMPEFGLAGAEIMCENLTLELCRLGHNVTIISMYDYRSAITERLEKSGVTIVYLNKKLGVDLSMINSIKRVLKELSPDVVHTHRNCAQYAIPACIMARVKCRVHTVHNVADKENRKLARIVNKFFFKHCNVTPVALSELIRDSIVSEYKVKKDRIPIVFNGINLSNCFPKRDYSMNGNFKILHIGRFSEQKNHIGLLKAFYVFHNKHPDSELWLIGDGEKSKEISQYVNENNLAKSVVFLGLQHNVYGFLHDADVFALPSNYEGIPMTLIEAMGTGLPIIATKVGGVPDMLDDRSAILIDVDEDQLADAFSKMYEDKDVRSSYGQKALELSQKFSSYTMAERYIRIYERSHKNDKRE